MVRGTHPTTSLFRPLARDATLPWPAAGDLQFQGKTQKGSNYYQQRQYPQISIGGANRHRADDIGSNEKFQTQQNGLAEIAPEFPITIFQGSLFDDPHEEDDGGGYRTHHNDPDGNGFDAHCDPFYRLIEALETDA